MRKLIKYTEKLKHLPRTGWLDYGINIPETVASHSWQMAIMAMQLANTQPEQGYDFNKVIKMCLCHDLGESIIGDITPRDKRYKSKDTNEEDAIKHIAKEGKMPELVLLYDEYVKNHTAEANLAHDLDKLDMYAQAIDYEKKYPKLDLSEFKESAIRNIKTKLGLTILENMAKI